MKQAIENLNRKFELLKDKFSKNEIILIYAQLQVEELIDDAKDILRDAMSSEDVRAIKVLLNQMDEFHEFIQDLLESRSTKSV